MRPLYSVLFCLYVLLGCQTKTFEDSHFFPLQKHRPSPQDRGSSARKCSIKNPYYWMPAAAAEFSVSHLPGAQLIEYDDFKPSDSAPYSEEIKKSSSIVRWAIAVNA